MYYNIYLYFIFNETHRMLIFTKFICKDNIITSLTQKSTFTKKVSQYIFKRIKI